jgi:hypothetical protein
MKEMHGNLWDAHAEGHFICITTNGDTRQDGRAVMGRGIARQAKIRFPELPELLGSDLLNIGNTLHVYDHLRLITFPVKHHWNHAADLLLIQTSAVQLRAVMDASLLAIGDIVNEVFLPRPGCGNGGLRWSAVKPLIAPVLDDRFTIVEIQP